MKRNALWPMVALTLACHSGGVDLKALSSEANSTYRSLSHSFSTWVQAESDAIVATADAAAAETRLHDLEAANARWDSLKNRILPLLGLLEGGQEIDMARLKSLFDQASALVGRQ